MLTVNRKNLALLCSCVFLLHGFSIAKPKEKGILALKVKHQVLIKPPGHPLWWRLKQGAIIPNGSLMQIKENSEVVIRFPQELVLERLGFRLHDLVFKKPAIIRVDDSLIRYMIIGRYQLSDGAIKKGFQAPPPSTNPLELDTAWNRNALVSHLNAVNKEFLEKMQDRESVDQYAFSGSADWNELKILKPSPKEIYSAVTLPIKIYVYWQKIDDFSDYEVYIWKRGSFKANPVAITKNNFINLPMYESGVYQLQVTSEEKLYRSSIVTFRVFDLAYLENYGYFAWNGKQGDKKQVRLSHTPKQKTVYVDYKRTIKLCAYLQSPYLNTEYHHSISVVKSVGKKLKPFYQQVSDDLCIAIKLNPGYYRWRVEAHSYLHKSRSGPMVSQASEEIPIIMVEPGVFLKNFSKVVSGEFMEAERFVF